MRERLFLKRTGGDEGALAILVSLVFLFVLLPAVALGMSSYTRDAVLDEKTRAADSGALAGAAALTLVNLTVVPTTPLIDVPASSAAKARLRAVSACTTANSVDNKLSSTFSAGPTGGLDPCVAEFADDSSLDGCIGQVFGALPALPPVTIPTLSLPLGLGTLVQGGSINVRSLLTELLPGFVHNGIKVTVNYRVAGPIDAILGQNGKQSTATTAEAHRRFKALLPDLTQVLPGVALLNPVQALLVQALQLLLAQLQIIIGVAPVVVVPLDTLLGPSSPVGVLLGAILHTTPTTLPPLSPLSATCKAALHGVVSDLQDALHTNPDPTQDLLSCALKIVFGLDPTLPGIPLSNVATLDTSCTDQLFRAELTQ